jgi:LysR family glycine cleavage system transcriptional activator
MCSPALKDKPNGLRLVADLYDFTLIHTERNLITWKMWLAEQGAPIDKELRGVYLDPSELAIEAAVRGVGIVLESNLLAARELEEGSLVPAFDEPETQIASYHLVYPEDHMQIPKVIAFTDWIADMANKYADEHQGVSV